MRPMIWVAAVLMLAACGGDREPTGNGVAKGSIRGTVIDNTGANVANAGIALTGNSQAARNTSSDANGVYTFADVPPGTYTLTITPPAGFTVGASATASVTVASAVQANPPAFILTVVIVNGSIKGTVTDVDAAAGVANAAVALTGNGQAPRIANSGAGGVYTFADLPPGAYALAITPPPGFAPLNGGTKSVTVQNGAQASASTFVLKHDSCLVQLPDFGGPASAEDLALFTYDVNASLNLQKTVEVTNAVFERSAISFTSPAGGLGLVTGIIVEPVGRTGLRPGLVVLHPSGNPSGPAQGARIMQPYAEVMAGKGAVVIAIDAPFVRRGVVPLLFLTAKDRDEQIQLTKDLQRAVDVLLATGKVDAARIGFEGYSYGGIMGAQFVGVEKRLKAAVLAAAMGGHVTGMFMPSNVPQLTVMSCAARNTWLHAMTSVEPIRFIPHASTPLFFQMGEFDTAVLPADAQKLFDAAPQPKEAHWYPTGHGLNQQALTERHNWWVQQIGVDP